MTPAPARPVEWLVAWDDGSWSTVMVDVPARLLEEENYWELAVWPHRNMLPFARYRKAVLIALYNLSPLGE